jgi:hypothetical protein
MAFVAACRERLRSIEGAFGFERIEIQVSGLRGVVVVLDQDLEVAARAGVHEVDELLRVLGAALGVVARGDDPSGRFLDEKQIVVVRRSTHRIVPRQEDQHFTAVRQRDQVVRLRSEPRTSVVLSLC